MPNLELLRDEMMACAARAKLPKLTILRKAATSSSYLPGGYDDDDDGGIGGSARHSGRPRPPAARRGIFARLLRACGRRPPRGPNPLRPSDVMYPPSMYGGVGCGSDGGAPPSSGAAPPLSPASSSFSASASASTPSPVASPEVADAVARYAASVAAERACAAPRSPPLFPPGRLLHLVRVGRLQGDGSVYVPTWTTRAELMKRIVVAVR